MLPPREFPYREYGWSQFLVDASLRSVIYIAVLWAAYVVYRVVRYVAFERKQQKKEGYLLTPRGKLRQKYKNGDGTWAQFLFGFDLKSPSTRQEVCDVMWSTTQQAKQRADQGEEINPMWQRTARMHLHIANNFDNYLNASLAKGYLKPA